MDGDGDGFVRVVALPMVFRIVVVADDGFVRMVLSMIFRIELVTAGSGAVAKLDRVADANGSVRVVVLPMVFRIELVTAGAVAKFEGMVFRLTWSI